MTTSRFCRDEMQTELPTPITIHDIRRFSDRYCLVKPKSEGNFVASSVYGGVKMRFPFRGLITTVHTRDSVNATRSTPVLKAASASTLSPHLSILLPTCKLLRLTSRIWYVFSTVSRKIQFRGSRDTFCALKVLPLFATRVRLRRIV